MKNGAGGFSPRDRLASQAIERCTQLAGGNSARAWTDDPYPLTLCVRYSQKISSTRIIRLMFRQRFEM